MNWTVQLIAFLPNALWFVGSKWAGDKRRVGWGVLLASEVAWVWLPIVLHLWSMLPWCVVGFALYARNYRKWATELTPTPV
jgi:hypothetical protein